MTDCMPNSTESPMRTSPGLMYLSPERLLIRRASHNFKPRRSDGSSPGAATFSGKRRRWSINSPASYLNAELIKSRLDLQRLGAFMCDDVVKIDANVAMLGEGIRQLVPEIRISTSTSTLLYTAPSPVISSFHDASPLAVCRDQKLSTPVSLRSAGSSKQDLHPPIPGVVLTSPSTTPTQASSTVKPNSPLDVDDMMGNLRSQVARLKPTIPQDLTHTQAANMSFSISGLSEDEWAFAKDILTQYGARSGFKTPEKVPKARHRRSKSPGMTLTNSAKQGQRTSTSGSAAMSIFTTNGEPCKASRSVSQRVRHASKPAAIPAQKPEAVQQPLSATTSDRQLYPHPIIFDHETTITVADRASQAAKKIQGILKRTKSVRFAAPPSKEDCSSTVLEKSCTASPTLHQPSPSNKAAVDPTQESISACISSAFQSQSIPAEDSTERFDGFSTRPVSYRSILANPSPATTDTPTVQASFTDTPCPAPSRYTFASASLKAAALMPRFSLSPSPTLKLSSASKHPGVRLSDSNKENSSPTAQLTLSATAQSTRKGENAGRCDGNLGTPTGTSSQKLRRSTPLKSIFTRFKP